MDGALRHAISPARRDLVTSLIGAWILAGAGLDAWAHARLLAESFFTPWHGVLYSGFVAMVGWMVAARGRTAGARASGSSVTIAGMVLFAVGGVGDLAWHSAFGVEREISAVTSPPHVALALGAGMMLSAPLRSAWGSLEVARWRSFVAPLLSAISVTTFGSLLFFHSSPFVPSSAGGQLVTLSDLPHDFLAAYAFQRALVASIVLSSLILFTPLIVLMWRWRLPAGATFAFIATVACVMAGVAGFERLSPVVVGLVGGALVEGLSLGLRARRRPAALYVFAGAAPAIFWAVYLAVVGREHLVRLEPELTTGIVVWTALAGLGVAALLAMRAPERSA